MMPATITPEEAEEQTRQLERGIDAMGTGCGLDPRAALGARVKLAICEMYERLPKGFADYIDVTVRHYTGCATMAGDGCDCQRTVEISYPDAGEPIIVH